MSADHSVVANPSNPWRTTWLDHLPIDICARISALLPDSEKHANEPLTQTDNISPTLALAAVSDELRLATAAAQSHVLRIEHVTDCHHAETLIHHWRTVLGNNIREVYLPLNVGVGQQACGVLTLPTISKAAIPNFPSLMRALMTPACVRVLELQITSYLTIKGESGLDLLPELLRSCPVEELCLVCHGCGGANYWLHKNCRSVEALRVMSSGEASTTLRSLRLVCGSRKLGPLIAALSCFPNLEEFHWEHTHQIPRTQPIVGQFFFSEPLIQRLRDLKSIGMSYCGTVALLLDLFDQDFGERVTTFCSRDMHTIQQMRDLDIFPNMRSIDLVLAEGSEEFFPTNLCSLRSISLSWKKDTVSPEVGYYIPQSNALAGLFHRNKQLHELHLNYVRIPAQLLEEILTCVGERLEILHIPLCWQDESPVKRFLRVIRFNMNHNRYLSELKFLVTELNAWTNSSSLCIPIRHEHVGSVPPNECVYCDLCSRVDVAWGVLKRRAPRLSADGFDELRCRLLPIRIDQHMP